MVVAGLGCQWCVCVRRNEHVHIFTYQTVKRWLVKAGICRQHALGVWESCNTVGGPGVGCAAYWVSLIQHNPRGRCLHEENNTLAESRNQILCAFPDMRDIFPYSFPCTFGFTQCVSIKNLQNSQTVFFSSYSHSNKLVQTKNWRWANDSPKNDSMMPVRDHHNFNIELIYLLGEQLMDTNNSGDCIDEIASEWPSMVSMVFACSCLSCRQFPRNRLFVLY